MAIIDVFSRQDQLNVSGEETTSKSETSHYERGKRDDVSPDLILLHLARPRSRNLSHADKSVTNPNLQSRSTSLLKTPNNTASRSDIPTANPAEHNHSSTTLKSNQKVSRPMYNPTSVEAPTERQRTNPAAPSNSAHRNK